MASQGEPVRRILYQFLNPPSVRRKESGRFPMLKGSYLIQVNKKEYQITRSNPKSVEEIDNGCSALHKYILQNSHENKTCMKADLSSDSKKQAFPRQQAKRTRTESSEQFFFDDSKIKSRIDQDISELIEKQKKILKIRNKNFTIKKTHRLHSLGNFDFKKPSQLHRSNNSQEKSPELERQRMCLENPEQKNRHIIFDQLYWKKSGDEHLYNNRFKIKSSSDLSDKILKVKKKSNLFACRNISMKEM